MIIAISILLLIIIFASKGDDKTAYTYNAQFGDSESDGVLGHWNHGFSIGELAMTKKMSYENLLLSAPTGSGKTSGVIFNSIVSLVRGKSSIIIYDTAREIISAWKFFQRKGYEIKLFDPSNANQSESFNPILFCKSISDGNKLALIIVQNSIGSTKGEPFWENSTVMLISLMIRYLVFHQPPMYRTMQNVLRLVEKLAVDGNAVSKLFLKTRDEALLDAYRATIVVGERTIQSIIATARTALQLWTDPEICKATATNTIDFNSLREKPTVLFITCPLKDAKYFKALASLMFQSLFDFTLSHIPSDDENSIFYLMEEFATMRFPDIGVVVSNVRKYKAGLLLCMQDEISLNQYGVAEAQEVKTNCSKVYLKGQPLHICQELSKLMGRYSLVNEQGKEIGTRELLTTDEIRQCSDAFLVISNKPVYKISVNPYYKNWWRSGITTSDPYVVPSREVAEPPVIAFE